MKRSAPLGVVALIAPGNDVHLIPKPCGSPHYAHSSRGRQSGVAGHVVADEYCCHGIGPQERLNMMAADQDFSTRAKGWHRELAPSGKLVGTRSVEVE